MRSEPACTQWKMMQSLTSCLDDSLKFFPPFPFKNCHGRAESLEFILRCESAFSPDCQLFWLKLLSFLPTLASQSLAFEHRAAEPQFSNNTLSISAWNPVGTAYPMWTVTELIIFPCKPILLDYLSLLNSINPSSHVSKSFILSVSTRLPVPDYSVSDVSLRSVSFSLSLIGSHLHRWTCVLTVSMCPGYHKAPEFPSARTFLHLVLLLTFRVANNHSRCVVLTTLPSPAIFTQALMSWWHQTRQNSPLIPVSAMPWCLC